MLEVYDVCYRNLNLLYRTYHITGFKSLSSVPCHWKITSICLFAWIWKEEIVLGILFYPQSQIDPPVKHKRLISTGKRWSPLTPDINMFSWNSMPIALGTMEWRYPKSSQKRLSKFQLQTKCILRSAGFWADYQTGHKTILGRSYNKTQDTKRLGTW